MIGYTFEEEEEIQSTIEELRLFKVRENVKAFVDGCIPIGHYGPVPFTFYFEGLSKPIHIRLVRDRGSNHIRLEKGKHLRPTFSQLLEDLEVIKVELDD